MLAYVSVSSLSFGLLLQLLLVATVLGKYVCAGVRSVWEHTGGRRCWEVSTDAGRKHDNYWPGKDSDDTDQLSYEVENNLNFYNSCFKCHMLRNVFIMKIKVLSCENLINENCIKLS